MMCFYMILLEFPAPCITVPPLSFLSFYVENVVCKMNFKLLYNFYMFLVRKNALLLIKLY
jgi:hypothetical protein